MVALPHSLTRADDAAAGVRADRDYRKPLMLFMAIVLAHWVEHLFQAVQIFALGWARPDAGGALGLLFPWLVTSEWLHYGYAIVMLVGLWLLRGAFSGPARTWWSAAFAIQVWHHVEHGLLLVQALLDDPFFGKAVPTSIVQLAFPRVELHLVYNAIVFTPMVVAIYLQFFCERPPAAATVGSAGSPARR
jgi:hypothetical protein